MFWNSTEGINVFVVDSEEDGFEVQLIDNNEDLQSCLNPLEISKKISKLTKYYTKMYRGDKNKAVLTISQHIGYKRDQLRKYCIIGKSPKHIKDLISDGWSLKATLVLRSSSGAWISPKRLLVVRKMLANDPPTLQDVKVAYKKLSDKLDKKKVDNSIVDDEEFRDMLYVTLMKATNGRKDLDSWNRTNKDTFRKQMESLFRKRGWKL